MGADAWLDDVTRAGLHRARKQQHARQRTCLPGRSGVGGEVSLFYNRYVDTNTYRLGVPSWLEQSGSFLRVGLGRKGAEMAVRFARE